MFCRNVSAILDENIPRGHLRWVVVLEVGVGVGVGVEVEVEVEVEEMVWMEVVVLLGEVFCWMELEDGCSSSLDETIGIALEELQPIVGNCVVRRRVSLRLRNIS